MFQLGKAQVFHLELSRASAIWGRNKVGFPKCPWLDTGSSWTLKWQRLLITSSASILSSLFKDGHEPKLFQMRSTWQYCVDSHRVSWKNDVTVFALSSSLGSGISPWRLEAPTAIFDRWVTGVTWRWWSRELKGETPDPWRHHRPALLEFSNNFL